MVGRGDRGGQLAVDAVEDTRAKRGVIVTRHVSAFVAVARGQADQYSLEVPDPCQVPVSFSGPPSLSR